MNDVSWHWAASARGDSYTLTRHCQGGHGGWYFTNVAELWRAAGTWFAYVEGSEEAMVFTDLREAQQYC